MVVIFEKSSIGSCRFEKFSIELFIYEKELLSRIALIRIGLRCLV